MLGRAGFGAPLEFDSAWANLTLTPERELALRRNVSEFAAKHVNSKNKPLSASNNAVDEVASFVSMVAIFMELDSGGVAPIHSSRLTHHTSIISDVTIKSGTCGWCSRAANQTWMAGTNRRLFRPRAATLAPRAPHSARVRQDIERWSLSRAAAFCAYRWASIWRPSMR